MALYEYVSRKCQKKFAEVLSVEEHATKRIECPSCKSREVDKVIEPFFGRTTSKTGRF